MRTESVDFLCIGAGLGGLAGAIRAAREGMSVLIVERSSLIGGVTSYSGGYVWVGNNHLGRAAGFDDSPEDVEAYLDFVSGQGLPHDPVRRRALIERSPEALRYFADEVGIPFTVTARQDHFYPTAKGSKPGGRSLEVALHGAELGPWEPLLRPNPHFRTGLTQREIHDAGGKVAAYTKLADLYQKRVAERYLTMGPGLAGAFAKAALVDLGIPCLVNAPAVELLLDGDRVVGAVIEVDGERVRVKAPRGVLIATGGYGTADYAAMTEGLPAFAEQAPPILHGDHFRLVERTPAAIIRTAQSFNALGFQSSTKVHPGTDIPLHDQLYDSVGYPHSIVVNRAGRRFGDETFYGTFITSVRHFDPATKSFPNYPPFLIADDRYRSRYWMPLRAEWPEADAVKADSIPELAERLGIDAEGLVETVERFNASVDAGYDEEFRRGATKFGTHNFGDAEYTNPTMGKISEPPFWGIRLELVGAGIYSMGLAIDTVGRVVSRSGVPVPGLYATGNAVAWTEVVHGYEGGLANTRNFTYAYLAAGHAGGVIR